MIPVHELLNRIRWDAEFAKGTFQLGYYDRAEDRVVLVPFEQLTFARFRIVLPDMQFAKVEFPSDDAAAKALHGIMQRGRITGLRDGTFIVPTLALEWLKDQGIPYKLVEMLSQGDVVQTLRDYLAHPV